METPPAIRHRGSRWTFGALGCRSGDRAALQARFRTTATQAADIVEEVRRTVEIAGHVYNAVKAGAIENLARIDLLQLDTITYPIREAQIFRYDWQPELAAHPLQPTNALIDANEKLRSVPMHQQDVARFLLGGFIFSGFAQASGSVHHLQPKRARMFLGLTAAPERAGTLGHADEDSIFEAARASLDDTEAKATWVDWTPPVLPYLLELGGALPRSPTELLDRALKFRESPEGEAFRGFAADLRGDGAKAAGAAKISRERRLDAEKLVRGAQAEAKSTSLEIEVGLEGPKVKVATGIPSWLSVWWNDWSAFDRGLRKTLRKMWLSEAAYQRLDNGLRAVWMGR